MDELMNDLKQNNDKFSEDYYELMKKYHEKMANTEVKDPNAPDEEGGITIKPNQGFCIKCKDSNGNKLFINIVSHDRVDAPKEEHILEIDNKYGVRLPLSLSERYEDFDSKNEMCQVYDVIFNPSVVTKAENDLMMLQFMMQLVSERIKQKYNQEISEEFVKLKNLKYKGKTMRLQRIRYRPGPKIEEVIKPDTNENLGAINNSKEISKIVNEKGKTPLWNIFILRESSVSIKEFDELAMVDFNSRFSINEFNHNQSNYCFKYFDGNNLTPEYGKSLLLIIELNLLSKSQGINLSVSDDSLVLNVTKLYSLELNLPFRICSKNTFTIFNTDNRLLYVFLPFYEKDYAEFNSNSGKAISANEVAISEDYLYDLIE
jgi:hypothetical protein